MTVTPTDSPALMMDLRSSLYLDLGSGTAFIISLRAVGNRKEFRMPYFSSRSYAFSASKRPLYPRMGMPKYQLGSSASNSPPAHAQSAGDQNMSPGWGKKSCECTKPGMLPMIRRCAASAPLGAPVVPLV